MRRPLNVKFLVGLITATVLGGVALYLLYGFQVRRHAALLVGQAAQAEEKGELEQATSYLERYLTFEPEDGDALARYGILLARLAQSYDAHLRALLTLDAVLRRQPERDDVRRWRIRLAVAIGQFAGAREHLEILQKVQLNDGELEELRGRCEEAQQRYEEAANWLEKAIKHAPSRRDNYTRLVALLREHLDQPRQADAVMDALVAANAQSYQAYVARALYREKFQSREEAAKDLARACELAPKNADVLLMAAELAQSLGNQSQARGYLQQGLRLHPARAAFISALASLEHQAGKPAEALACLREGLKVLPEKEQRPLLCALADLLIQEGKPAEAAEVIGSLRQGGAPPALLQYYAGRLLMQKEEWHAAAALLQRVLQMPALDVALAVKANLFLGLCYEKLGDPDQQLEAYRRAVTLDSSSGPARLALSAAQLASGRLEPSPTWLSEILALRNVTASGWTSLAQGLILQNLRLPPAQRDWKNVEAVLDRAVRLAPQAVDVLLLRARVLAGQGHLDRARTLLEQARYRQPDQSSLWIALAEMADQPETAHAILEQARFRLGNRVELKLAHLRRLTDWPASERGAVLATFENCLGQFRGADEARFCRGLAEAHARLGNAREAERLWVQVAQRQPNDLGVRLLLFDLALQAGKDDAMQRLVGDLRRIEGEDGTLWRYCEAARLVTRAKRGDRPALGQARIRVAELAGKREGWSRLPLIQAEIDELEGHADQAIANYQRALEMGDRRPVVTQHLARLLYQAGRYAAVDALLRQLQEQTRLSGELGRFAFEIALNREDCARALALARQAVADEPGDYRNHLGLGLSLWAAAQRQEAEASLRRALALADNVPDTWVALVYFLALTDQKDLASAEVEHARSKLPKDIAPLVLAHCYQAIGRLDDAAEQYRVALARRPGDPALVRGVADNYLRGNQFARAEPHLRTLLAPALKAPADDVRWARRNLAIGLALEGSYRRFKEALALLEPNFASGSATPQDERARAIVLSRHPSRRREAIRALESLRKRSVLAAEDEFLLAQLYEASRDWPMFRERMDSLLRSPQANNPILLAQFARTLLAMGQTAEAQVQIAELERQEPFAFRTVALKALLLKEQDNLTDAVALVEDYLQSKGADNSLAAALLEKLGQASAAEALYRKDASMAQRPESALALVECLGRQGRLREALDLCDRARQTCPPEQVAAVSLAVLRGDGRATKEDYQRVEGWLKTALGSRPEATKLLLALAELRDLEGRYRDAAALYRRVLEQDKDNLLALNNLACLLALQKDHLAEAASLIDRALDLAGPVAKLLDTRAVIRLAADQIDLALKDLNEAVAQSPTAASYFHLAEAYGAANDKPHVTEALRKAQAEGLTAANLHPLERPAFERLSRELGTAK